MGSPFVFSKKKLKKPFHREVVTILVRGVVCPNGCGLYYVAPTPETMEAGDVCPGCNVPPKPWDISSEPEEAEISVKMAFGNITDVELLRTLGPTIQKRTINLPIFQAITKPSGL